MSNGVSWEGMTFAAGWLTQLILFVFFSGRLTQKVDDLKERIIRIEAKEDAREQARAAERSGSG